MATTYNKNGLPVVKDINGETEVEYTYNHYGNITSMTDSEGQSVSYGELLLERGYTGHEHLPQFGLINMNARLYEPLTARFLSPQLYLKRLKECVDNILSNESYKQEIGNRCIVP